MDPVISDTNRYLRELDEAAEWEAYRDQLLDECWDEESIDTEAFSERFADALMDHLPQLMQKVDAWFTSPDGDTCEVGATVTSIAYRIVDAMRREGLLPDGRSVEEEAERRRREAEEARAEEQAEAMEERAW